MAGWEITSSLNQARVSLVAFDDMPFRALARHGGEGGILIPVAMACDTLLRLAKLPFCNLLSLIRMASIPPFVHAGFERAGTA